MGNVVVLTTGPLYTLEEVKEHLRVDTSDDDATIQAYMDAAESAVLQYCHIALVPVGKESVFKVAAMMYVSALYENRSGSDGLPRSSMLLLDPYRWLRV
ncbi:phage gp6-like head-tail connector protein [Rhizobium deserti]|uniref:Phage gp6-like head-tail connector protein n=1 Tax=Rhizobium deserti TaxID=2547961 RepID=A0A4R5UGZ6_9HYPH|nr:head-tail connector protein [Rhizobium deserti]TDK35203.1 phage gp6-like head-tail connector protein [Rhizobium deserti]